MSRRSSRRVHPSSQSTHRLSALQSHLKNGLGVDRLPRADMAAAYGIEQLERRVLFTTINGSGIFEFLQGSPAVTVRVAYTNVTAELIGVAVPTTTDIPSPGVDLVAANTLPVPTVLPNLFEIYIASSTLSSSIAIAEVPAITTPGPRPMDPFTGGVGTLAVVNASTVGLPVFNFTSVGGQVLIGNKFNGPNDANRPVITAPATGPLGVYPGSGGAGLEAGIQMAPVSSFTGLPNDMGRILIGGTILGAVNFPAAPAGTAPLGQSQGGNVGLFYAGEILTGNAAGVFQGGGAPASSQTPNFVIGGDLRDLYTDGPIGGDIGATDVTLLNGHYFTGFYGVVAGTLGSIYQNQGGLQGTFDVQHSPAIYGLPESLLPETEVEYQFKNDNAGDVFQGLLSGTPQLGAPFTNDTAATPQYLGSITQSDPTTGALLRDVSGNIQYSAYVTGILQATSPVPESDDNYAVPLLAGQTITITLTDQFGGFVDARLVDPSGRVVASNENRVNKAVSLTTPFSYTADRPGEYTIDVHYIGGLPADDTYSLKVDGVGNMGLGTARAATNIYDGSFDAGFRVDQGDLGALIAGSNIATGTSETIVTPTQPPLPATTIDVGNGSLREVQAPTIGVFDPVTNRFGAGPFLLVPEGAVGLIRATDPLGFLDLFTNYDPSVEYGFASNNPGSPVGGNFQEINGAGAVFVSIATNQGIGNLLAGSMATDTAASFIDVNADNAGNDGIIDLIDVAGDLGTLGRGGPAIVTHTGGDVRYMTVGGAVFEDSFFGGGFPTSTQYAVGQAATIADDSGSSMVFAPTGQVLSIPVVNADGTTSTQAFGPQLTLQTYGIRDKGGVVVLSATSTGGLTINSSGTLGSNSQAEIGTVSITGTAPAVVLGVKSSTTANGAVVSHLTDANGEQIYTDTTTTPESTVDANGNIVPAPLFGLTVNGPASTDVMRVVVNGNANSIENLTQNGEIGGISVGSVGTILSYGTLGLLKSTTGAALLPFSEFAPGNTAPFNGQLNGIVATNNVFAIEAYQGLGNIFVSGGIQQVTANANGRLSGVGFEGIDGPVVAVINTAIPSSGRILNVSIGQGILPAGTGTFSFAGIFAENDIGTVTNNNVAGADIRGDIVSKLAIDNISLSNGSIIGATIASVTDFAEASPLGPPLTSTSALGSLSAPAYTLRNVSVNGRGGIIGTFFTAANVGTISVGSQGFGLFEAVISVDGNGVVNSVSAGGYGIRDVFISSGASLNSLSATGNGSELSIASFGTDVRQSESGTVDPFFNTQPSYLTDLDHLLGTSASSPIINGVTDTGIIEDVTAIGSTNLGLVSAQIIRTASPLIVQTNPLNPVIPVLGSLFPMQLSFGTSTGSIIVRGIIDGLELTTGTLGRFIPGGSVSRCGLAVSGAINKLVIHGNYGQTITSPFTGLSEPDSYIQALGVNGVIGSLKIFGSLAGNVLANSHIGSISIGGNVIGNITINGQTNGAALGSIRIGGTLSSGSLVIDGSAGSISTNGSLGALGDSLTVTGSLKSLTVGANRGLQGSDLALNLNVQGGLGKLTVFGRIDGAVNIAGDLGSLAVTNDGSTTNVISGAVSVGGKLGTGKLIGGNLDASLTVNGDINSLSIANGSVLAGEVITSRIGTLKKFTLVGGAGAGVFGSINTPNGVNESIDIGGNFGDGTDASAILAYSASKIRIRGNVAANTSITTTAGLASLEVDGNVAAGATITGHPIGKQKIVGTNSGTITAQ